MVIASFSIRKCVLANLLVDIDLHAFFGPISKFTTRSGAIVRSFNILLLFRFRASVDNFSQPTTY